MEALSIHQRVEDHKHSKREERRPQDGPVSGGVLGGADTHRNAIAIQQGITSSRKPARLAWPACLSEVTSGSLLVGGALPPSRHQGLCPLRLGAVASAGGACTASFPQLPSAPSPAWPWDGLTAHSLSPSDAPQGAQGLCAQLQGTGISTQRGEGPPLLTYRNERTFKGKRCPRASETGEA